MNRSINQSSKHRRHRSKSRNRTIKNPEGETPQANSISEMFSYFEVALDEMILKTDSTKEILDNLKSMKSKIDNKISLLSSSEEKQKSQYSSFLNLGDNSEFDSKYNFFLLSMICPFCESIFKSKLELVGHIKKGCSFTLCKEDEKSVSIPFSIMQILPNNTFKCNVCPNSVKRTIKDYFLHVNDKSHLNNYDRIRSEKSYSDNLFCSCCKVLVYNTFMQIETHINHEYHKNLTRLNKPVNKNGILFVCLPNNKFKCLVCFNQTFRTNQDFVKHLFEQKHKRLLQKKHESIQEPMYCEICDCTMSLEKFFFHAGASSHKLNEKKNELNTPLQLCLFCNFHCFHLTELSNHFSTECVLFKQISNEEGKVINKHTNLPGFKEKKIQNKMQPKENKKTEFIVKGNVGATELYLHLKKFGNLTKFKILNENMFEVHMDTKDVNIFNDSIEVNGRILALIKSKDDILSDEEDDDEDEENDFSSEQAKHKEAEALYEKISPQNYSLEESKEESLIILDLEKDLSCKCYLVGYCVFALTDPTLTLSIFCNCQTPEMLKDPRSNWVKLVKSDLWDNCEFNPTSAFNISCVHKATKKRCTITNMKDVKTLSDILSDCCKKEFKFQYFFRLVKFWFETHKIDLDEMSVVCLIVFFLISRKIIPFSLKHKVHQLLMKLSSTTEEEHEDCSDISISDIFKKFLIFLHEFDFKKNCICLPIGKPIPKEIISQKNVSIFCESPNLVEYSSSPLCLLGPFLQFNFGSNVTDQTLKKLLSVVEKTIDS